jgi:transglutaminase-like putative cysteine protease
MKKIYVILLFVIVYGSITAQIISNPQRLNDIEKMLKEQQQMLGQQSASVFNFLQQDLSESEMQAMKFLYAYMPLSDMGDYSNAFFLQNVKYTLKALEEIPWVKNIPEDEFLHFVLPVRVNNENLDPFRVVCYNKLKERVKDMNMYDAALEVNHWCHEYVTYKASDGRTSSPLNTMKYSFGRCGEESVFTVAAMRTVGIPARQVYTPRWAHSDDNHAWVEVWIDGTWYFLGACEPEPELNMGWFAFPASRAMLVHTRAYGKYFGTEEVITAEDRFSELNLISNYAETKNLVIKVYDPNGLPFPGAEVDVLLYNYAELYPIASKVTSQQGITSVTLGLGEVIVWATNGELFHFEHVQVAETDTVHIQLGIKHTMPDTKNYHFTPPLGTFTEPYSGEKAEITRKRLMYEDSLRASYMSTFKDSLQSQEIASKLGYSSQKAGDFIHRSYGNYKYIIEFLEHTPDKLKDMALMLLGVLSEKDLRDATAEVLFDHLSETAALNSEWLSNDEEMFITYILNGRIANENMTAWRSFLKIEMTFELIGKEVSPALLEQWVQQNIKTNNTANLHSRAPLSPQGVYKLRMADTRSRDIFFIALCRTFGFPARLHPETRIPQYFFANQWNNVWFDIEAEEVAETANLYFTNPKKSTTEKYYNTFTLAQIVNGRMKTLEYDWSTPLTELEGKPQEVFAGDYVLVKGIRLSEGTVLSELMLFQVKAGEKVEVNANAPQLQITKHKFGKLKLKNIVLEEFGTSKTEDLGKTTNGKNVLLVFIDPDKEPSKHVMHDLALVKSSLEESGILIYYILSPHILSPSFDPSIFKGLPKQGKFLLDKNNTFLNLITRHSKSTELPLVCLVSAQKRILFLSNGYRIGTGDEILRLLQ